MKTIYYFILEKGAEITGRHPNELKITPDLSNENTYKHWCDIAERYAAYMCQQQKEIDFKHAKLKQIDSLHMCPQYVVDKDSILNAPLATDKNK